MHAYLNESNFKKPDVHWSVSAMYFVYYKGLNNILILLLRKPTNKMTVLLEYIDLYMTHKFNW